MSQASIAHAFQWFVDDFLLTGAAARRARRTAKMTQVSSAVLLLLSLSCARFQPTQPALSASDYSVLVQFGLNLFFGAFHRLAVFVGIDDGVIVSDCYVVA